MLHVHHRKLIIIGLIFLASWLVGTVLMHQFEQGHPIGESYFNAFYFTVITTATIGFGDLVPMTVAGKIVTMLYAIFYVPLFLYAMNILFQANFRRIHHEDVAIEREMYHVEKDVEIILSDTSHKKKTDIARKKRHLIAEK